MSMAYPLLRRDIRKELFLQLMDDIGPVFAKGFNKDVDFDELE